MKKINFDVDIDLSDRSAILDVVGGIQAGILRNGVFEKHNTGVYFQPIPFDPETRIANIDYKDAEHIGYFKIDFLNVSLYEKIKTEEHLIRLLNTEPVWELLTEESFVKALFHIGDYYKLVKQYKPTSVEHLAMLLAIIRPAKRHLQGCTWEDIAAHVWEKPTDGSYAFKKAHAISYAVAITVQMNLLVELLQSDTSYDI